MTVGEKTAIRRMSPEAAIAAYREATRHYPKVREKRLQAHPGGSRADGNQRGYAKALFRHLKRLGVADTVRI